MTSGLAEAAEAPLAVAALMQHTHEYGEIGRVTRRDLGRAGEML